MNQDIPGPLPTKRVFLSEIPNLSPGYKIRFLGCISKYKISTGVLTLEHKYRPPPPSSASSTRNKAPPSITVDVNLLLEDLNATDLQVGTWINVLGYVREEYRYRTIPYTDRRGRMGTDSNSAVVNDNARTEGVGNGDGDGDTRPGQEDRRRNGVVRKYRVPYVQAVMVIPAGPIRVGEYERVLRDSQDVDRRVRGVGFRS